MKKRLIALVIAIVLVLSMSVVVLANPTGPMHPSLFSCSIPCTVGETYTYPAYYNISNGQNYL